MNSEFTRAPAKYPELPPTFTDPFPTGVSVKITPPKRKDLPETVGPGKQDGASIAHRAPLKVLPVEAMAPLSTCLPVKEARAPVSVASKSSELD